MFFFSINPGGDWNCGRDSHPKVYSTNLGFPSGKSHHQDYYIFSKGSHQPKPSFATLTGKGDNPENI